MIPSRISTSPPALPSIVVTDASTPPHGESPLPATKSTQKANQSKIGLGTFQRMINAHAAIPIEQRLSANSLDSLPSEKEFSGTEKNTHIVVQGEAHFLDVRGADTKLGLATFGAGPCAILIAVARDEAGNVSKIGMAHQDANITSKSLDAFFGMMKGSSRLEVSLLGGDKEAATSALQAADRAGAAVKFASANIGEHEERVVDAVVDRNGKIYNGMLNITAIDDALMARLENVDVERKHLHMTSS